MRKHHPKNERIKRQYFIWLQEAKRLSPHSVDQIAAAISLFEVSTNYKDFAAFHIEQARNFKKRQAESVHEATGKPLAKATIKSRFEAMKAFLFWLADQPGYRSKIKHSDSEYFNISANDARIATAKREKRVPELAVVHRVIDGMKADTPFQRRARAVIAFTLLTIARDDALASFRLGDVDLENHCVVQDARHVRTKFRKTFTTTFYPVGGQAEAIVQDWVAFLKTEYQFGASDPLFPSTLMGLDANGYFAAIGFKREHWKNADPVRAIFKEAFTDAGLPYFNPHSVRATVTRLGMSLRTTEEEFKAWSQNMGHEDEKMTRGSYGQVSPERQAEIILALGTERKGANDQGAIAEMEALLARMKAGGRAA